MSDYKKMPMLPGFKRHFDRRRSYGKRQVFGTDVNGAMMMDVNRNDDLVRRIQRPESAPPARSTAGSRSVPASRSTGGGGFGARPEPTSAAASSSSSLVRPGSAAPAQRGKRGGGLARGTGGVGGMSAPPAWLKYDRKVLRFYGYFVEDVEQSSYETQRVRKVVIYYYLADSAIHIAEPKVANSGMPQGVLVAKTKASNPAGGVYAPADFMIGGLVHVHARTFVVTDADKATRAYMRGEQGLDLGEPMDVPVDRASAAASQPPRPKLESIVGGHRPDTLRKFMEHDKQVLSFSCFWDDTKSLYGEKRKFVLNFYLCNDKVEVREVSQPNSGRDPYPLLLKAQKLPKAGAMGAIVLSTDLRTGETIRVFGRDLVLVDCDRFTRDYYRSVGVEQRTQAHLIGSSDDKPAAAAVPEPPHNGFGDPEDALQSHYALNPKPAKKNTQKAHRLERKVLRFRARLIGSTDESDASRRFVVQCFLSDDTVSIFEPPIRNSGVVGGKFMERGKYRHMAPPEGGIPRFFKPGDFFVGAICPNEFSPHQQFELVEADAFTLKYCEGNSASFPFSNIETINAKLVAAVVERAGAPFNLRDTFAALVAGAGAGAAVGSEQTIDKEALCEQLHAMGLLEILEQQELITLVRRYDEEGKGCIRFHELCDDLSRAGQAFEAAPAPGGEGELLARLRSDKTSLRKVFRRVDKNADGTLSMDEWMDLLDYYRLDLSEDDAMRLFEGFDTNRDGSMAYNEFCDAVYPCTFGGAAAAAAAADPAMGGGGGGSSVAFAGASSATVGELFAANFGGKKWALRKAFRAADGGSGLLGEDEFMDAISGVAAGMGDEDKFALACGLFPSGSSRVEWGPLMAKYMS